MALVVKDRVKETTTTTGTGTVTLGGAVQGFQTFTSVLSNADTTYYAIIDYTNHAFEVGLGTFTSSGTTLARTTILESSNSGSAVDFGSGTKEVFITYPAEKSVYLDASNQLVINGTAVTSSVSELNILDGKSFVDEDNMSSNSATAIASQQSIKAYVDSQVTAQDLDATTDSGTIDIDLDSETLTIAGGEGIDTSASGTTVTISGEDASTSNKGIASFSSDDFSVSSGAVTIKSGGVTNTQLAGSIANSKLANSSITVSDGSNTTATALGGTITFSGTSNEVDVAESSGTITIGLPSNVTISGELDVTTLDVSGNADIDGTLEADAITIDGVTLAETISDTVGAMVSSNTETNITVTYDDSDNTLDFVIGTLNQDTTGTADNFTVSANNSTDETVFPVFVDGATGSQGAETDTGLTYNPSSGMLTSTGFTGALTGNASTATILETARTLGGVSFNGSANINLPGVNTAGDQNTTGNAATATLSSTVTVTDSTANTNFPVVFHDESNSLLDDTGALRYNPSTGELLVPKLTVAGATTVVDTVTMNASNAIIFEGATADAHETTLSIVDPTADHTQYLINQGGYIPVLSAATTTAITSTPAELNIMDGDTSASSTTVADADRVVLNDNGTMKQVAVTDLSAYFDDEITAMPNLVTTAATTVGALNSGSITSGFGTIDTGSSAITTTGLISGGSLDIDDVLINGTTIGHTNDSDLITVADGLVTIAGEISTTTLDIGGTNVTSTAAELNILDGVTSTAAELNILDGVTSTAAELNILDGVTSTATELNIMDGDTSASSTTLADADRVVANDNGTMKQVALTDIKTYLTSAGYASQDDATALAIALG